MAHLHDSGTEEKDVHRTTHLEKIAFDVNDENPEEAASVSTLEKRLVRRVDLRMLPICAWMYLLNYLDRGNIGNSKVLNEETGNSLLQETGMSLHQYALAVTLFSVAYCVFEVPSNWVIKNYVRPSRWLAFLLVAWGGCTMAFAAVNNFAEVVVVRVLIGVFEAGFFPGIIFLITFWYRPNERSIRIALIVASATLAGAFGGCIAYGVGHMNGVGGLSGWQWLSILEGLLTVLSVVVVIKILPDHPKTVKWLTEPEKTFAHERVQDTNGLEESARLSKGEVFRSCVQPRMLLHYTAYLINSIPLGSLTFFSPTIVAGLGFSSVEAQIMTVPPWIVGWVMSLLLAYSADRFNERSLHVAGATIIGGAGWLATALLPADAFAARYGCMMLCACGAFPSAAPLSAWVTSNAPSLASMAFVIAINNSTGGLSQLISQWMFLPSEVDEGYPTAYFICAACSFGTAAIVLILRVIYTRKNKEGGRKWYT